MPPKPWQDRFRAIVSVYLLLINEKNEVLLLKRGNTGFKDGEYGLPAGHVDGGEECRIALARETKEEIGVDVDPESFILVHTMHRNCGDHERVDFFFRCEKWRGEPVNREPHKHSELYWASLDTLPLETIDYYAQMFACVKEHKLYSQFGWSPANR